MFHGLLASILIGDLIYYRRWNLFRGTDLVILYTFRAGIDVQVFKELLAAISLRVDTIHEGNVSLLSQGLLATISSRFDT